MKITNLHIWHCDLTSHQAIIWLMAKPVMWSHLSLCALIQMQAFLVGVKSVLFRIICLLMQMALFPGINYLAPVLIGQMPAILKL